MDEETQLQVKLSGFALGLCMPLTVDTIANVLVPMINKNGHDIEF